jgi:hypothetical protein
VESSWVVRGAGGIAGVKVAGDFNREFREVTERREEKKNGGSQLSWPDGGRAIREAQGMAALEIEDVLIDQFGNEANGHFFVSPRSST